MKIKQVTASILAGMMIAAGCVGCGSGENKNTQSTTSSSAVSTAAPAGTEEKTGKIVIFQNCGIVQSSGKAGSNSEDLEAVKKYVKEATGIDVETIIPPTGEEINKLNMMLASQEPIDLFWDEWTKYANDGAIQPLTKMIKESGSSITEAWGDNMDQVTDKNGDIYGIPRLAPLVTYPVYVRTDWLKEIGKEAPATIDELEEVLKLFKDKDPAGNGKTIPLMTTKGSKGMEEINMTFAAGFMGAGYGYYIDSADNYVKPSVLHPGYKDFVAKMADWYSKGYIYKEAFATDKKTAREMVKQGIVGSSAMWYSTITMQAPYINETDPDAGYTLCTITGPKGKCETVGDKNTKAALVPTYSKNADLVVKYMNWVYEDVEHHIITENGIENVNWKYADKENHIIETINSNYIGDLVAGQGVVMEAKYAFNDPIKVMHYDYLHNEITKKDRAQAQSTADVIFNKSQLSDATGNLEDIERMTTEEVVKFIIGARPMSEFDSFVQKLYEIGIDKEIKELTRQYNEAQ